MVEVVVVERYKALNGHTYSTLAEAEKADAQWRQENECDVDSTIAKLVQIGQRNMSNLKRNEERREHSRFPMLYVLESKHSTEYYLANTADSVPLVYFEILKFNKACEYYYTLADKTVTDEIVRTENHLAAIAFVDNRNNHQYERVTTESVTIFS